IAEPDPLPAPPFPPVPYPASIEAAGTDAAGATINRALDIELAFSITGPIRMPRHADGLWVLDSIVDAAGESAFAATGSDDGPGAPVHVERSTMIGAVHTREASLASESIFIGGLFA